MKHLSVRRWLIVALFMLGSLAPISAATVLKSYALALFVLGFAAVVLGFVLALSTSRLEERL